jgi:hypothetical protein
MFSPRLHRERHGTAVGSSNVATTVWRSTALHIGSTRRQVSQLAAKSVVDQPFPQFNTLYDGY